MKQKLVLAMCLLLLFLVSCSNNSFTNPFGGTPSEVDIGLSDPGVDIHTGNRGVVLSKIYCPKKVTENENFICSFKMTNYGPHRVNGLLTMILLLKSLVLILRTNPILTNIKMNILRKQEQGFVMIM